MTSSLPVLVFVTLLVGGCSQSIAHRVDEVWHPGQRKASKMVAPSLPHGLKEKLDRVINQLGRAEHETEPLWYKKQNEIPVETQ